MLNGDIFFEMAVNIPIIAKINRTISPATWIEIITIGKININVFTMLEYFSSNDCSFIA